MNFKKLFTLLKVTLTSSSFVVLASVATTSQAAPFDDQRTIATEYLNDFNRVINAIDETPANQLDEAHIRDLIVRNGVEESTSAIMRYFQAKKSPLVVGDVVLDRFNHKVGTVEKVSSNGQSITVKYGETTVRRMRDSLAKEVTKFESIAVQSSVTFENDKGKRTGTIDRLFEDGSAHVIFDSNAGHCYHQNVKHSEEYLAAHQ